MPLAYYSRAASQAFWAEHWAGEDVRALVDIARASPLTRLIEAALPPAGRILEAGCGLGQYVVLLRERGHAVAGADWSLDALRRGRAGAPGTPLAAMDLGALGIRSGALHAYVSLGVVEHDPGGPGAIVAEAARVLAPGGRLLLSVPYWNGMRRLGAPRLKRQARRLQASGGEFYQFAFSRREVWSFLEAHGFRVLAFHPYDPARIPRKFLEELMRRSRWRPRAPVRGAGLRERTPIDDRVAVGGPHREGIVRPALKRLAYSALSLRLFAHMILAVAVRA